MKIIDKESKLVKDLEEKRIGSKKAIGAALRIFGLTFDHELVELMKENTKRGRLARRAWVAVKIWLQENTTTSNLYQLKRMDELEDQFINSKQKEDRNITITIVPDANRI